MAAAVYGGQQLVRTREIDGLNDVGRAGTTGNQRGMTVERAIPKPARLVVPIVLRQQ